MDILEFCSVVDELTIILGRAQSENPLGERSGPGCQKPQEHQERALHNIIFPFSFFFIKFPTLKRNSRTLVCFHMVLKLWNLTYGLI